MSTIENSTTTFYELMINNNNINHHNQSSLQDAVAFDASPAASHATTRPSGGHARTAEATSAVSRSVPAQRPFGRLPPCAKVETSSSSDGLNVLYHVIITLVQLWFSVRRKKATMVAAPFVGRVRGRRRDLGPALRAAAARRRCARNAASRRGRNRAHVPQPALLPTPPAPAETSAEDACQYSPPPLLPTPPAPLQSRAELKAQRVPSYKRLAGREADQRRGCDAIREEALQRGTVDGQTAGVTPHSRGLTTKKTTVVKAALAGVSVRAYVLDTCVLDTCGRNPRRPLARSLTCY
ncbi:unnamed protein product [Lampetra fluviatilis]